jgi:hypothetical protein
MSAADHYATRRTADAIQDGGIFISKAEHINPSNPLYIPYYLLSYFLRLDPPIQFNVDKMASPNQNILLVLGAGPNVGRSIAQHFSKVGSYKTILVSRNPSTSIKESCDLVISADFEDAKCINGIFEEVKEKIGVPNVVVYNGKFSFFFTTFRG